MLWQNNPVFGMLSWVISSYSGKDAALDSRARLSVHQRDEAALRPQLLGAEISGHTPSPSWRCHQGSPCQGTASPEDAKALHLVAIRVGISFWWGSLHAELRTRSPGVKSASRPALLCARAARSWFPGGCSRPVAHPLAPAGHLPPRCLGWTGQWDPSPPCQALSAGEGMLTGGEAPVEAQP